MYMRQATEDSRPPTPEELTAAKHALLSKYYDPTDYSVTDAVLEQMMATTLHTTPDEEKLVWGEKMAWNSNAGGEFAFSDEKHWGEKMTTVPLGGLYVDKQIERMALKDTFGTTNGGSSLIPVGIVPQLYVLIAQVFGAWTQFPRVPANGVRHSWRNLINFGADEATAYIDEYGCPTSTHGTYTEGMTNIAIMALRRSTSLRLELLAQQVGFRFDGMLPSERELKNAMTNRARILEKTFFQGTTASGHDGTDEFGTTFTNGFNGWRVMLSNAPMANSVNGGLFPAGFTPIVVEQSTDPTAKTPITDALDLAVAAAFNNGANPAALRIHMPVSVALKVKKENSDKIRFVVNAGSNPGSWIVGGSVNGLMSAVAGFIPFTIVLDQSIGTYTTNSVIANGSTYSIANPTGFAAGTSIRDCYLFATDDAALPYIGSPDPLPIEIPVGLGAGGASCLTRDLIIYLMVGLANYAPNHHAKIRVLA